MGTLRALVATISEQKGKTMIDEKMHDRGTEIPSGRRPVPLNRPNKKKVAPPKNLKDSGLLTVEGIGAPPAPNMIRTNDDAMNMWAHLWTLGKEWLTDADSAIVAEVCEAYAEREYLRRQLLMSPEMRFYKTNQGQIITHPIIAQRDNASKRFIAALAILGFTPTDRAKMGLADTKTDDTFSELANERARRAKARAEIAKKKTQEGDVK